MGKSDFLFAEPSFIEGLARIFDFGNMLRTYNESPDGDTADAIALFMDWNATGDDIAQAAEAYGRRLADRGA